MPVAIVVVTATRDARIPARATTTLLQAATMARACTKMFAATAVAMLTKAARTRRHATTTWVQDVMTVHVSTSMPVETAGAMPTQAARMKRLATTTWGRAAMTDLACLTMRSASVVGSAKRMKMETASVTRTTSTDARRPRHAITILRRRLKMEAVTSSHVLSLDATIPTPATTTRTWTSTMALACTHNSLTTVMGSA